MDVSEKGHIGRDHLRAVVTEGQQQLLHRFFTGKNALKTDPEIYVFH